MASAEKEFEFEGVQYLLSDNMILWRWDSFRETWVIHAYLMPVKNRDFSFFATSVC